MTATLKPARQPRTRVNGSERAQAVVLLLCLGACACAAPPRMIQEPRLPACRNVVDGDLRPSGADVQWFSPASGADRRLHAEWCATVGPLVVDVEATSVHAPDRAAAPDAGGALAIVSWNTHVGGADVVRFVRDLRAGRWSGGRRVDHFVLLLQEAFRRGAVPPPLGDSPPIPDAIVPGGPDVRADVVALARALGLSLFYAPSMRNGAASGEDRGNAILATVPLSGFRVIELPFERQRRIAVAARVRLPGPNDSLHVASAHFDNRAARRRLFVFSPAGRTRQAEGLLAALPAGGPLVLGGDFNTWLSGREGALVALRRAFPHTPSGSGPTYASLRLDYLFFRLPDRWSASWRVIDETFGSDHHAVLGWIDRGTAGAL